MAGAGHGPGCHSQLPPPPPLDTGYLHNTSFSKYQFIHVQSIQRHCIIWTLEACVYVLWVSVLKSNVSLFTVRVGPPSSVISKPLSHYCITHRGAGVVGEGLNWQKKKVCLEANGILIFRSHSSIHLVSVLVSRGYDQIQVNWKFRKIYKDDHGLGTCTDLMLESRHQHQ